MSKALYFLVMLAAKLHDKILTWNDSFETMFSDKQLHFLVIGAVGMMLLFVIYPLFKLLSRKHVLIIAWMYVFTVVTVLAFAIEIGQKITGTGNMEFDDIIYGVGGFMVLFLVFVILRGIAHVAKWATGGTAETGTRKKKPQNRRR